MVVLQSCEKSYEPPPYNLFENQNLVTKTAKEVLSENVSFTTSGYFESDTLKSIVAGIEISENNSWGINFYLISWVENEFQVVYSTGLLSGSFIQCNVDKVKFSNFNTEMIYYNSEGYFIGTAGGDVYSHVIDFGKRKTYSAHLLVASRERVSLELSDNIENLMIKNFFISYFRRDYPSLRVAESGS